MQKNTTLFLSWMLLTLIVSLVWFLRLHDVLVVGLCAIGSLIGFLLPIFLDILLPRMMAGTAKADSTFAKEMMTQGLDQVRSGNLHSSDSVKTPLRSYPLLLGYALSAVFVITSTQNWFGRGFVLGLGLSLILDLIMSRRPIEKLKERWFSVFHANLSDREFDYFVYGSMGIYALLLILALAV